MDSVARNQNRPTKTTRILHHKSVSEDLQALLALFPLPFSQDSELSVISKSTFLPAQWGVSRPSPISKGSTGRWPLELDILAQEPTPCNWPWRSCTMDHANMEGHISSVEKTVRQRSTCSEERESDLNRTAFRNQRHSWLLFTPPIRQLLGNIS